MKKTCTSLPFPDKQLISKAVFSLLLTVLLGTAALGQNPNPLDDIGDLSGINWKTQSDLSATLAQEQARMDLMLTDPNLQLPDRSLFMSYKRLLGYVDTDVQDGKPVHEAVMTNYEKVVTESETDPDLKNMPSGSLFTLIPGLVEALTKVPVAGQ